MRIGVFLNYVGLGANLLHLSYCHEIAKKYGPINIITLCDKLQSVLEDDPNIKSVKLFDKKNKTFFDIFKLSKFLKKYSFDEIFIYYPSFRTYVAAKISGINKIHTYNFFKKKNLHLVKAAKELTIQSLKINECKTETNFFISKEKKFLGKKIVRNEFYNIVLGVGSSGPSTKWGGNNYINLINKLNNKGNFYFYLLCGPDEKNISDEIIANVDKKKCKSLDNLKIPELIPIISNCNLYVGNDSFGHHIMTQCGIPCVVLILDTPRAYTDYSSNHYRIIPDGIDINSIEHDTSIKPNEITVEKVINKILDLKS